MYTLRCFYFGAALSIACTTLEGAESRIPKLFEYQSVPESSYAPGPDVFRLENFIVVGSRYQFSDKVMRELTRDIEGRTMTMRDRRIEIVPDGREDMSELAFTEHLVPMRGTSDALDLKLQDMFLIDLPGGGVLKAQFKSGLSMRVNRNMKIILRPSRKKLISFRWDW